MSKQTAVEWLEKELLKNGYVNKGYHNQDSLNHLENLFVQAKAMEREQIIEAAERWKGTNFAEQYYNETFGK